MSFVKPNGGVRVALVALVVLVGNSQVAQAETIFLKCGSYTYTVDLTNRTVDGEPAFITPLFIDYTNNKGDFPVKVHVDRTTGEMTGEHHGHSFSDGICTTVSQPPTKF